MAQVTPQGIVGVSLNEYLAMIEAGMLAIDPKWNIEPDSPDGQKNGIDAETLANLDEGIVAAYRSKDPASATGESLNDIGAISGVPRQFATFSVAPITLSGTPGASIPAVVTVIRSRIDNTAWTLNSTLTIGPSGTAAGFVTCVTAGRVVADAGELTVIGTPTAGLSSATNPSAATQGQPEETDQEFRIRRSNSVSLAGSNMLDNMYASLGAVSGVTAVQVYENTNISPADANGVPVHGIAVVVNGGSDQDIGEAIRSRKNPGAAMLPRWNQDTDTWIDPPGDNGVLVYVTSPKTGLQNPITFQRAKSRSIFIKVMVQRIGILPSDIEQQIVQAIILDATKSLFSDSTIGFNQGGYDIGEIVPVGRFYTPVNKVLGKYGDSYATSITIGRTADSLSATPIQPAYNELATFSEENIDVVVAA